MKFVHDRSEEFTQKPSDSRFTCGPVNQENSQVTEKTGTICASKIPLARHGHCDVYFGARETVGGSSVSSGCWGEDSDHKKWMGADTPTFAPIRFLFLQLSFHRLKFLPVGRVLESFLC